MWDLLLRMIMHPVAYAGARHTHVLTLKECIDEGNGIFSFIFTSPESLNWAAGQHGVFYFDKLQLFRKNWRAFSIASSANEHVVMISTLISEAPSDFKKKLLALEPGEHIIMRGPFGEFQVTPNMKKIVGIAGGIGITPFRSILMAISAGLMPNVELELIYAGKNNYYAFEGACRKLSEHPQITITYTNTIEEVNAAIDDATARNKNNATYFISGSPGMIAAIRGRLQKGRVTKIINDPFKGY